MKLVTVLVVEDEEQISRFVKGALLDEGYEVYAAGTLRDAMVASATRKPDLVILDLGLPDGDGCDLISEIRSYSAIPIVVLSARIDELDKIAALDAGADDFLTKPFGVGELLARVRAQLRRQALRTGNDELDTLVQLGDVSIDIASHLITKGGETVHLTKLEFRLLCVLIAQRGKVLTQRQLLQQVWGPAYVEHPHYLRIYMAHLRQKLENDPARPQFFLTETGVGYRLAL